MFHIISPLPYHLCSIWEWSGSWYFEIPSVDYGKKNLSIFYWNWISCHEPESTMSWKETQVREKIFICLYWNESILLRSNDNVHREFWISRGRTHVCNFSSLEPFMVTGQKDCAWSPTRHEEVFEFSLAVPEAQTPVNSWELMKLQPDKNTCRL